jgi:hypothetical protein
MFPSSMSMESSKKAGEAKVPPGLVTEGEGYEALTAITRRSNAYSDIISNS